ncbi:HsdM family class I SAM-dependent methyltransferase [Marinoscillum sp.]|uniref:HsdM family class I SAM-dependent methyltransferase n=1 Tax=Marinoscillum sp. TaxID=2024838 RepID=UPI003BA9295C
MKDIDIFLHELQEYMPDANIWYAEIQGLYRGVEERIVPITHSIIEFFNRHENEDFWSNETIDEILEVFENVISKSKNAHQLLTPSDVAQILSGLPENREIHKVYDPFCRSGNLLNMANGHGDLGIGEAPDAFSVRFAKTRFFLLQKLNVSIDQKPVVGLRGAEPTEKFDLILTNPPFGKNPPDTHNGFGYYSSKYKSNDLALSFFTHALDSLSDSGLLGIVTPAGMLSNSGIYVDLRKELIEKNMLEAVLILPQKIFYGTGVSTSIWVVNKQKKQDKILLINLSEKGRKSKERYELPQSVIQQVSVELSDFRSGLLTEKDHLMVVNPGELDENLNLSFDYNFNKRFQRQIEYASSVELIQKCSDIQSKVSAIQKEISSLVEK